MERPILWTGATGCIGRRLHRLLEAENCPLHPFVFAGMLRGMAQGTEHSPKIG